MTRHDPDPASPRFLWGVATSAYQSEGGYNLPGTPHTNWAVAESRSIVAPSGRAAEFWDHYAADFDNCRKMGLTAFRLSIEWSRVQPTHHAAAGEAPPFDQTALDAYARIVADCIAYGLEPIVTLHHFVHPAWLGQDAWLQPDTADHFVTFVQTTMRHINRSLVASGSPPPRYYITINEPGMLVLNTYLGNQFPAGADRTIDSATRACNQLLRAHILAYNCIHDLHGAEGWHEPEVTLNSFTSDLYGSDKMFFDLLVMREKEIEPSECPAYIRSQAADFNRFISQSGIHENDPIQHVKGVLLRKISQHLLGRFIGRHTFGPALDALYQSPRKRVMDYIAMDYYDPFCAHALRLPIWWDHEFRSTSLRDWIMNSITSKWWDWRVLPKGLRLFCEYYAVEYGNRPLLIAENGMAQRRGSDNRAHQRGDRISRSEFIRSHTREVIDMVSTGIPLLGYLHWSLFDNYEWGTYAPRFGIFSLDYPNGTARHSTDPYGDCPSDTYAEIIRSAAEYWKHPAVSGSRE